MKLSPEQVRHVAKLARLSLSDDEVRQLGGELSAILDAVALLGEVDTGGVPATVFSVSMASHARPDEVSGQLRPAEALANAPLVEGTSFAIPRVIE